MPLAIVLVNIGADFIHQLLALGSHGGIPFIESIRNDSFQARLLYSGFGEMQWVCNRFFARLTLLTVPAVNAEKPGKLFAFPAQ